MPHQTAHSPHTSNPSSDAKTPSPSVQRKVAFNYSVKVITPRVVPRNRQEILWDAIIKNEVEQLNIVLKPDLKRGLIVTFIGADFNVEHQGENALTLAAKLKRYKMVKILAKAVGTVEIKNASGDAALHIAIRNQDYGTTLVLLQKNADYKILNKQKINALMLAYTLRIGARATKGYELAKKIEVLVRNHSYQFSELKFDITIVSAAERSQRVKELRDQKIDPTKYLSTVYVK